MSIIYKPNMWILKKKELNMGLLWNGMVKIQKSAQFSEYILTSF